MIVILWMRVGNVRRLQILMGRHGDEDHQDALPCVNKETCMLKTT